MSRLVYYLNENRSVQIDKEMASSLMEMNCKKAVNSKWMIYRGNNTLRQREHYFKSGNERTSPYARNNIYNLLLSNLPSWKKYPIRNKSLVCTTNKMKAAGGYGGDYYFTVYPYDGTLIGIAPEYDIWESFRKVIQPLDSLNYYLNDLIYNATGKGYDEGEPRTYRELLDTLSKVDEYKEMVDDFWEHFHNKLVKFFTEKIPYSNTKNKKLIDLLNKALSPEYNNFELRKVGEGSLNSDHELWFEGQAILLPSGRYRYDWEEDDEDNYLEKDLNKT